MIARASDSSAFTDDGSIVELPRAMTFEEFARQYSSPIPTEELALINQVYDTDEMIPAGTAMKRVVG